MGSTPSAIPAHYRSSYGAQDAYQGNSLDANTNMTNSNGGGIEQQSASSKPSLERSPSAAPPGQGIPRSRSAKGSKADKIAAAIAAGAAATAAENAASQQQQQLQQQQLATTPLRTSASAAPQKDRNQSRSHKPSSSLEFSVQGNSNTAAAIAGALPSNSSSSAGAPNQLLPPSATKQKQPRQPAPSPGRSETPPTVDEEVAGTDHASYFETRSEGGEKRGTHILNSLLINLQDKNTNIHTFLFSSLVFYCIFFLSYCCVFALIHLLVCPQNSEAHARVC